MQINFSHGNDEVTVSSKRDGCIEIDLSDGFAGDVLSIRLDLEEIIQLYFFLQIFLQDTTRKEFA